MSPGEELEHLRVHDLLQTFTSSNLVITTVNLKTVQELQGHSQFKRRPRCPHTGHQNTG